MFEELTRCQVYCVLRLAMFAHLSLNAPFFL